MRLLLALCLAWFSTVVDASPWLKEAAVAYVEELAQACATADPDSASSYEAKKDLLFSTDIARIKQAQSGTSYPDMRKWAHDTISAANPEETTEQCRSFLTQSDPPPKQADADSATDVR